jgi:predicted DNA-binding antitoxin AbrB/MazE fold protein
METHSFMQQIVEAVYENGVFRPAKSLELFEGQEVQLIVQTKSQLSPKAILQLAAEVYQGLSNVQIDEVEQLASNRQRNRDR